MWIFSYKRTYFVLVYLLILAGLWTMSAPSDFPRGRIINISEGMGLQDIGTVLEANNLIRSQFWFRAFSIMLGGERRMKAGEYYFAKADNAFHIAWRIENGDHKIETVKVTIPEGFTTLEISEKFDKQFVFFDNDLFEARAQEGYLFPDTYFIPITATATSTIRFMRENFDEKVGSLLSDIAKNKKTLKDVVIMASLIEAEANNQNDREIVAGILWKRLKIGMPLQVDAEMGTYEFQGLPATPINNPGLLAIKAATYGTTTPYLYYLTGKDGKMHYARTFDEHKNNIAKYLQ